MKKWMNEMLPDYQAETFQKMYEKKEMKENWFLTNSERSFKKRKKNRNEWKLTRKFEDFCIKWWGKK